jgi:ABC-2 type transport system permease protein
MLVSSTAGNEITNRIEDGSISLDFVRPLNLKVYLFCNDMGTNAFKTFVVFVPFCMLLTLGYGFELPKSPMQFIAFLATVICGTFIMFYYSYILGLLSFWLIRNPFISWHFRNVETLFSGQFVPIWFYPSWLAALTQYLPFRYFTYEPISIYLGRTPFSETGRVLLIQAFWMLFMYLIERWIWSKAFRRVMVQGG